MRATCSVVYGEDEEVDMSQLMHDITGVALLPTRRRKFFAPAVADHVFWILRAAKIHKADKALKCKAEAEKQGNVP